MYKEECIKLLSMFLENSNLYQLNKENLINEIKIKMEKSKIIIFCGTFKYIEPLVISLKKEKKEVYFIDRNIEEGIFLNCPVLSLDDIKIHVNLNKVVFIILSRSSVDYYTKIVKIILNSNSIIYYSGVLLAYEYLFFGKNGREIYTCRGIQKEMEDVYTNIKKYLFLFDLLEDEFSKEILARIILFRLTYSLKLNEDIKSKYSDYLDEDLFLLKEDEVIVDAGGYIGDTLYDFIQYYEKNYQTNKFEYYLFEPFEDCIIEARKVTEKANIHFYPYGLGDKKAKVSFNKGILKKDFVSSTGTVASGNPETIVVKFVDLDSCLENISVSYIKMDIEGSEKQALQGARKLILKNRPKLAICLYHKYSDIIDIIQFLSSFCVDYKYFIRAQKNSVITEFVLYALPIEKSNTTE